MDPAKLKQSVRVFWKLMNPQECVWEIRCRSIIKTILQEKERVHYSTTIWLHKFIPMPQAMKILAGKAAVDKEWEVTDVLGAFKFQDQKNRVRDLARIAGDEGETLIWCRMVFGS